MEGKQTIVDILSKENALIESLIDLGKQKRVSISDANQVAKITGEEQKLLYELGQLEKKRENVFSLVSPLPTVEEWLQQPDTEQEARLVFLLRNNLEQLQKINEVNKQLVQESLAYVQFSLNVLMDDPARTYAKGGSQTQSRSFFDRKV